ncbi:elongation factor G [Clostridium acetireducens DSM 10703]|uniref:Elongation factor G n=1 Tax=Clostridium acetireducens DSM 10703 TaxID=1121290 RepID=A0A1E8F1B1_9CLOT|nr:elongation factor G [Clostridium acetireducens]OFI06932.1 elongation factor G [Clostridium acetireducens DSM 10703]
MKSYRTENIRNVSIIGHSGSGKTTLIESILYYTKNIDRMGKIEEGNTISDYNIEEKNRGISISTSIVPCEWNNVKVNFIDTPGYFDFIGETLEGIKASDISMIVVSSVSGMQVGVEKDWDYVNKYKLPRAFYINKLDRDNSKFKKTLESLKEYFGMSIVPVQYPIGEGENFKGVINVISRKARIFNPDKNIMEEADIPENLVSKVDECNNMIVEAVAENDEILLEKYFDEGKLSNEEIYSGLIKGCSSGDICPVMCGSALTGIGMQTLMEDIVECFPSPNLTEGIKAKYKDEEYINVKIDENEPFSAFVFKTIVDPFVGKLSLFKVISGKIKEDSLVYNANKNKNEKISSILFLRGKEQIKTSEIIAGDIGAVAKLQYTSTGDTLTDNSRCLEFQPIEFPEPMMPMAIIAKSNNDEDKISTGINKILQEDITLKVSRDIENAETIIWGIGETHIDVLASKLKNKFGIEVILETPKVPYRETIKKSIEVQGKYKKQSGGHGQYGDVKIRFEPRLDGDDLEFIDKIVGGVVPKQYIPSVEKGLIESMKKGVLAGYPVIRLKATLYDGSYHSVDSSDMAFKVAASMAYKKGLNMSEPVLLEPIMHVEVLSPEEYMGDIIGDINKKRGRVLGMIPEGKIQKVICEIPQAEIFNYTNDLKSITQGRGTFSMKFEKYEEVPDLEAEKIINSAKEVNKTI